MLDLKSNFTDKKLLGKSNLTQSEFNGVHDLEELIEIDDDEEDIGEEEGGFQIISEEYIDRILAEER